MSMNVLLFHSNKDSKEMIGFCLESQMGLTIKKASDFKEAIDFLLDEDSIDLIITSQEEEIDKLFKYLLSTSTQLPLILVGDKNSSLPQAFPEIKVLAELRNNEVPEKLIAVIRENFNDINKVSQDDEYCRISTELLLRVVPLKGDVYIRLSSVKFVKFFRSGAQFTQEDFEKFLHKKKINYLYIKKSESQEFVNKFKEDLAKLASQAHGDNPELIKTVSEVQELIQELSSRVGFTEEVIEITRSNVTLALKAIGSSPKISKTLANSQLKNKNYISSHSVLLANISCSIAAHMNWPSNTTFHKLVLASLFHDIVFQDSDLAKIKDNTELEEKKSKLTEDQYNLIKSHPLSCADIVKTLTEIPGDVDFLVLQHHERPDGSGFPKGLRSHQIPPLSALFIVAHDILNEVITKGENFKMEEFLISNEKTYESGSFKKIWKALKLNEIESDIENNPEAA